MKPVSSVLLATSFPPVLGGMETLLYQTARHLAAPPVVVAPPPVCVPDLRVVPVGGGGTGLAERAAYRVLWRLHPSLHYTRTFWRPFFQAMRAHRPRVIQVGHVYLAPLARIAAGRLGIPYVLYVHGREVWREGRREGIRAVDERLRGGAVRAASATFVHGAFTASLVRVWDVPNERLVRVPYGSDARPPLPPAEGAGLLSVARLVRRKGIDTVIRLLPRLAARYPDLRYTVVGLGPDEGYLQELARAHGVSDRVQLLGRIDADDPRIAEVYRRASVFVLPTRPVAQEVEGFGLVYLEAAAWGRPAIAGSTGGEVDAVLDGQTGLLVDGADSEAVFAAIDGLLADPTRARALGQAGRERVERQHNWQQAARVVDETLATVSARRTSP